MTIQGIIAVLMTKRRFLNTIKRRYLLRINPTKRVVKGQVLYARLRDQIKDLGSLGQSLVVMEM